MFLLWHIAPRASSVILISFAATKAPKVSAFARETRDARKASDSSRLARVTFFFSYHHEKPLQHQGLPGVGVKRGLPRFDPAGVVTPADPAGVGVKKYVRGHDPAGVGVGKKVRGHDPDGVGVKNIFRGHNPAGVGVKIIFRGHDPAGVGVGKKNRGRNPA